MKAELEGLVIAVTGSGGGVGTAIAERLAKDGAYVFLQDQCFSQAEITAEEICKKGGKASAVLCDIRDASQVEKMAGEILEKTGKVDILVNAADVILTDNEKVTIDEYDDEIWKSATDVGLNGTYNCTKQFVKIMKAAGEGRVINVASTAGIIGIQKQCAPAAAQSGVIGFTRALAAELGAFGIRVNAVAPGAICAGEEEDEKAKALIAHIPLGRQGSFDDLASAVAFLADPASNYITGAVLTVDGGWTSGFMRDW